MVRADNFSGKMHKTFSLGVFILGMLFELGGMIVNSLLQKYYESSEIQNLHFTLPFLMYFLFCVAGFLQAGAAFFAGKVMGYLKGTFPKTEIILLITVFVGIIPFRTNLYGGFHLMTQRWFIANLIASMLTLGSGVYCGVCEHHRMRRVPWRNNLF